MNTDRLALLISASRTVALRRQVQEYRQLVRQMERQTRDAAILTTAMAAIAVGVLLLLRAYDDGATWLEFGHGLYAVCGVASLAALRWTTRPPSRPDHDQGLPQRPGRATGGAA